MIATSRRLPWQPIAPLDAAIVPSNGAFAGLEALRGAWLEFLDGLSEPDRVAVRRRSLRRLAIETGIIERLYDVEWGLTLTLVAEGFAREVVERAQGRIDEDTLETLAAQRDSLEMVVDFVRDDRPLSSAFIRELHAALTRTQIEHEIVDSLGRADRRPMPHGEWKTQPNHVRLEDGTLCECVPPEQVQSEIDRLLALYVEVDADARVHPIVKAAWLHHRFVQIHPFSDGNGRVARALTLLVLEKNRYAPLVVDRFHRAEYMAAIQQAPGNLSPLIALFTRLESAALASELERPEAPALGVAVDVARTLAARIAAQRVSRTATRDDDLRARVGAIVTKIDGWLDRQRVELSSTFAVQKLSDVKVECFRQEPDKIHWFRSQIEHSARTAGHHVAFTELACWWHLRARLPREGLVLSFVVSLHGVGYDAGVMAVTTFGQLKPADGEAQVPAEYFDTSHDAFQFAYTEGIDALDGRGAELEALLDAGLSAALARLLRGI